MCGGQQHLNIIFDTFNSQDRVGTYLFLWDVISYNLCILLCTCFLLLSFSFILRKTSCTTFLSSLTLCLLTINIYLLSINSTGIFSDIFFLSTLNFSTFHIQLTYLCIIIKFIYLFTFLNSVNFFVFPFMGSFNTIFILFFNQ